MNLSFIWWNYWSQGVIPDPSISLTWVQHTYLYTHTIKSKHLIHYQVLLNVSWCVQFLHLLYLHHHYLSPSYINSQLGYSSRLLNILYLFTYSLPNSSQGSVCDLLKYRYFHVKHILWIFVENAWIFLSLYLLM